MPYITQKYLKIPLYIEIYPKIPKNTINISYILNFPKNIKIYLKISKITQIYLKLP